VVTVASPKAPPELYSISKTALENNRAEPRPDGDPDSQIAIGVGRPGEYMETLIVDPGTFKKCPAGAVGEIWVGGPTLARGYMNRPEVNREVFGARLDTGEGPYMRTGDLGFIREDGELFIGGRRKDLIIIRGKNHYPQDIEKTAEESCRAVLRPGCNAAFSVDAGGEERLVLVQELNPHPKGAAPVSEGSVSFEPAFQAVRAAVTEEHGVDPYAIVLIKPGTIPKTSSGKIQRRACRDGFERGGLEVVAQWRAGEQPKAAPAKAAAAETAPVPSTAARDSEKGTRIRKWLRETLSKRLSIPLDRLDENRPFAQLGLDSREGIILVGDLEKWLGTELPVSIIYDHPSIDRLVRHLEGSAKSVPEEREKPPAKASDEPVAIVGIGCRFPGAESPEAFWNLLRKGADAVSEVPPDRWDREAFYDADPSVPGKMVSRYGGFLKKMDMFDPQAFDITAREAARMDPQQRLLLEVSGEALENAGITPASCAGSRTGVFIGISSFDYGRHLFRNTSGIDAYYGTGAALSIAANRISYQFDLHGPSMAIDTACSSSLVAVHAALASLRRGECSMALVGGVNAILLPDVNITFTKAGVLSPNGHCRTFDAKADGITRAEGAGVVVLKPLSRAVEDGDHVWAVIKGSAVNSDGRSNGLMAPNGSAQREVIAGAYKDAGADPAAVQYIEAHGTGTILGDPIEVGALASVISRNRQADRPCRIGSVKANFGHLEAGAGIAGLIKVAMSIHNREFVPSIQFSEPNPSIPFDKMHIKVQTSLEPWEAGPAGALAGVSSFGFGGTNAHVVVGEGPARAEGKSPQPKGAEYLIPISARSAEGLRTLASEYVRMLGEAGPGLNMGDLAWTASMRRRHLQHRLAAAARSPDELKGRIEDFTAGKHTAGLSYGEAPAESARKLVYVFPGQGGQWWGMARELLETEPVFKAAVERCDDLAMPVSGWSLVEELKKGEKESRVNETEYLQPMLFSVQFALCEMWRSLGVEPDAVVGHSMGEVAAACAAGKLELDEALRIIVNRGRIMKAAAGRGAMAAVELSLEDAQKVADEYPGRLSVAANNAPGLSVLAGDPAAIARVSETMALKGIFCRELRVEVAGHSPDMEPLKAALAAAAGEIPRRSPRVHIVSTVTGVPADALDFDAAYWAQNLREPVRFRNALEVLLAQGYRTFLEIGPHPVLQNAIAQIATAAGVEAHAHYTLKRDRAARSTILDAAGFLYTMGMPVDFSRLNPGPGKAMPLPTTPWDRQRCWMEAPAPSAVQDATGDAGHPLLSQHTESPSEPGAHFFEGAFDLHGMPWVSDHRVQGHAVFPATGYIELVRAAAERAFGGWNLPLEGVGYHRALILGDKTPRTVSTVFKPAGDGRASFQVFSRAAGERGGAWILHASGTVGLSPDGGGGALDLKGIRSRCTGEESAESHYGSFLARSIDYRGPFKTVRSVVRRDGEALGEISFDGIEDGAFNVHPGLLDSCLQVMGAALPKNGTDKNETFMPVGIEAVVIHRKPGTEVKSHAVLRAGSPSEPDCRTADVFLADAKGAVWGVVKGLKARRVEGAEAASYGTEDWLYKVEWVPGEKRIGETAAGPGSWLLVCDRSGLADRLAGALAGRNINFIKVLPGKGFKKTGDGFETDLLDQASVDGVLEACAGIGPAVSRVVYMGGMDEPASKAGSSGDDMLSFTVRTCGAVLNLVQGMARKSLQRPNALWVVTRNAEPVLKGDSCSPGQAALWGLGRSVAHEQPDIWGGMIDIDGVATAEAVADEIGEPGSDDQIAFRGAARMVPRLVHLPPPAVNARTRCSADGTYLVTGGLGALGLRLAEWLAKRGAKNLLLTGRSAFPDRAEWGRMAAGGDARAAALLVLENSGVRVEIAAVDSADQAGMLQALGARGLPPLKGIVHAAGVVTPKNVLDLTVKDLEADMRAKVAGTWTLQRLAEGKEIEFFVMFSSASAIWGSKLLAGYGAANHFMDGIASMMRALGRKALSVNWAMWGGGGMSAGGEHDRILQRMGMRPMPSEKAIFALEELVAWDIAQATVADVDWQVLKPLFEQSPRRRLLERLKVKTAPEAQLEAGGPALLGCILGLPDRESRHAAVVEFVLKQSAEVLGLSDGRLDHKKSLLAQGLDSLNASDLRGRIQKSLGVKINVLTLLKGDSPGQLAERVFEQLASDTTGRQAAAPRGADTETLDEGTRPETGRRLPEGEPREALLTGATGFLGVFVLADLLALTGAKVHCLVKAGSDIEAMGRITGKLKEAGLYKDGMERRIVPVAGDMSQPRLGLDQGRWDALAGSLDRIYHVGFAVNFLFSYEDLRPANVTSYKELLRLACASGPKPVHFVSSFSVLLTKEYTGRTVGDDETLYPAEGGYREGKRACERLTAEIRGRGLPAGIYRPPFIGWHGTTGFYNERDFLIRLIKGCLQLGSAPDLDALFYITPVDFISSAIVKLSMDPAAAGRNYNVLSSPDGIPWTGVVDMINNAGGSVAIEPFARWRERLDRAGSENPLHIFFPAMGDDLKERGSAVLDLFHRGSAPSEIRLDGLQGRLGRPPQEAVAGAGYFKPLIERMKRGG
jgi:thioester reductase-like protein